MTLQLTFSILIWATIRCGNKSDSYLMILLCDLDVNIPDCSH